MSYAGVVFDMDGILVDSEPLFRTITQRTARSLGYTIDDETYVMWMGLPPRAVESGIRASMGDDFPMAAFRDQFRALWNEHTDAHGVPAQPGMGALLKSLRARGVPFGVATSTQREQAERSLALAGLLPFIDVIIAGNEVERGKPAPDIFLRAAAAIGVPASRCVALEDSAAGVRSASAAQMLTVMVPDLHPPSDEIAALAHYVLPSTKRAARMVLALFGDP